LVIFSSEKSIAPAASKAPIFVTVKVSVANTKSLSSVKTPPVPTKGIRVAVKLVSCNSLATIVPLELMFPLEVICDDTIIV